ncbi:hypothetical protein QJS83_13790 [Bdellovibrio sp. 22V]|uniref:hypothetical protein n=1 Tax=Bdellovibrio TaxID=958 RepID=UPI002543C211|nr:hypothetical protein [Bdellovibrio sp. 22V]WII71536.1 hypothetical protein QJS83_13790 [Bdellovibrio sp. 22V]
MNSLLQELKKFPQLFLVGAILCAEHLLTLFFWLSERPLHWILSPSTPSVCWPIFSACEKFKPSEQVLNILLSAYGLIAVIAIGCWAFKKFRWGVVLLWALTLFKVAIILQDYRLTGNYHYLPTVITLCFLLVPQRVLALPVVFFLIYFTAGLLKLDMNWLSGAAINDTLLPPLLTRVGVWYVLVLELGLIFLLFAKKERWFYFLFVQLVIFHLYSWHLTRFFYPSVMLLLLGVLLITRPAQPPLGFKETFRRVFASKISVVLTVLFIGLQLPQYLIPGDAALTGEGRMYAMIMYDGRVQCQPHLTLWKKNQSQEQLPLQPPWLMTRTRCDAMVYWRLTENICAWVKHDPEIVQVDFMLPVRSERTEEWRPLVSATDVCENKLGYSSFFPNAWINKLVREEGP